MRSFITLEPVPEVPGGTSKKFQLDWNDLKELLKQLVLAFITAAIPITSDWAANTDFGASTPIIVMAISFFLQFVSKVMQDNTRKVRAYYAKHGGN